VIPEADRRAVATALAAAERDRAPIGPPSRKWPRLDAVDAYEIQLINARERLAAGGVVRGHKVGLTSRAMQQMLGVGEPDYGHLFADMFVSDGGTIAAAGLCYPRAEIEVAFVLGDRVSFTPSRTRAPALATASAPSTTVAPIERAAFFTALAAALPVPNVVPLLLFFA